MRNVQKKNNLNICANICEEEEATAATAAATAAAKSAIKIVAIGNSKNFSSLCVCVCVLVGHFVIYVKFVRKQIEKCLNFICNILHLDWRQFSAYKFA